mmetsp:Transcript_18053/g.68455  ORF Transcript_18053/g.68455 Transcript_18053/m.68455 type:complete len:238 (-) Transcript_18053:410-1123(-)
MSKAQSSSSSSRQSSAATAFSTSPLATYARMSAACSSDRMTSAASRPPVRERFSAASVPPARTTTFDLIPSMVSTTFCTFPDEACRPRTILYVELSGTKLLSCISWRTPSRPLLSFRRAYALIRLLYETRSGNTPARGIWFMYSFAASASPLTAKAWTTMLWHSMQGSTPCFFMSSKAFTASAASPMTELARIMCFKVSLLGFRPVCRRSSTIARLFGTSPASAWVFIIMENMPSSG